MEADAADKTSMLFLGPGCCQCGHGGDFLDKAFLTNAAVLWFQDIERQGQPAERAL